MENKDRNELVQSFFKTNREFLDEIVQKTFKEWIEQFMQEDMPDDEKILNYTVGSVGTTPSNDNSGIIKVNINFSIDPAFEKTIWKTSEHKNNYWDTNICYIEIEILDEENYRINYIGTEPKNLAEFQKQFEEYKKEHQEIVVVGAEESNEFQAEQVVNLSHGITLISSVLVALCMIFVIIKIIKIKK